MPKPYKEVIVVLSDIAFIVVDGLGYFTLKAILHPFIYGVKLKIEFIALNMLVVLSRSIVTSSYTFSNQDAI